MTATKPVSPYLRHSPRSITEAAAGHPMNSLWTDYERGLPVKVKLGNYSAGLSRSLVEQAVEAMDTLIGIDDRQTRICYLTPRQWSRALCIPEFASADWADDDVRHSINFALPPEKKRTRAWKGVVWVRNEHLLGQGTSRAVCKLVCRWKHRDYIIELRVDDTAAICPT